MRVFEPPTKSSGQPLDADLSVAQDIEGGFLVELQLQQGDRFYFSGLFHELLLNFTKVRPRKIIACMHMLRSVFRESCVVL